LPNKGFGAVLVGLRVEGATQTKAAERNERD
jgi:hypothetical protein